MEPVVAIRADLARSHPAHCPPWCIDCEHHDFDPPGTSLHRSPADTVPFYDEGCELVDAHVRAAFWDKPPEWSGTDPADLERPHVEVSLPDGGDGRLYLNPRQARRFAAALVRAANAADTEASHRPPPPPAAPLVPAPASAPSPQA
jgi:hypothetical protein